MRTEARCRTPAGGGLVDARQFSPKNFGINAFKCYIGIWSKLNFCKFSQVSY